MIGIWLIWKLPKWVVVVSSLALLKFIPHPLGKSSKKVVPENILFDDLVGLEDAKPLFQKILHRVCKGKNKQLEIGILDVVLLYGPKGTGKTTLVHALAREAKVPFLPISARDIARSEAGREEIKSLFIEARASTPSIVYIQDIDAIFRQGESGESEETLYELCDEIEKCIEDGRLMVIDTTDRPETLDPILMSRFIRKMHVGRPNEDSRRKFFGLKFNEFIKEEDREAIYNLVASQTPSFVWGDLIRTVLISLQLAARRDDNYMTMDAVLESLETTKSAFNETEAVVRDHMQHMVNTMDFKYQN